MPPFYDIYGLSNQRDKETIEIFLDYFSYRDKIENRIEGEGIFIEINENRDDDEFIPVKTLTEVIEYGLNNPNKTFVFYVSMNKSSLKNVEEIILCFTCDKKIVLGISIEENRIENGELVCNSDVCKRLAIEISQLINADKTIYDVELAPPRSEDEFIDILNTM